MKKLLKTEEDWMEASEGQLAVDVYQTADSVVLQAPIAGVKPGDLEISITDEVINIKGERRQVEETTKENYFARECYWGSFSRTFTLPAVVNSEKAEAKLKDGILTIKIPKIAKTKTKVVEIKEN